MGFLVFLVGGGVGIAWRMGLFVAFAQLVLGLENSTIGKACLEPLCDGGPWRRNSGTGG